MPTREEIREGIQKLFLEKAAQLKATGVTGNVGNDFMNYLHSQGVVIKVDRELPDISNVPYFNDFPMRLAFQKMLNAGYVATVPLIEDVK